MNESTEYCYLLGLLVTKKKKLLHALRAYVFKSARNENELFQLTTKYKISSVRLLAIIIIIIIIIIIFNFPFQRAHEKQTHCFVAFFPSPNRVSVTVEMKLS